MSKFSSKSREELERYLEGVVILGGEGSLQLDSAGPAYVAVIHDGSGFTPGAAIAVDQNPYHDLSDDVLETAHEIMVEDAKKDKKIVAELRKEWGDRWEEILTEPFGGKVWTLSPADAAAAIRSNARAARYVEIEDAEFEVIVGNIGAIYRGNDYTIAHRTYTEQVNLSKSGIGRTGGEPVTLMVNGEIEREHAGREE